MKAVRNRTALSALVLVTTAATLAAASPAFAAAPGNDLYAGATAIGVGFTASVDTAEAGTDGDDADLNAECGAPATDASVWYRLSADMDRGVVVDTSGSDYTAGVVVATGAPGSWSVVSCGPETVGFTALAGDTYTVMVFDDQMDEGGNGGNLELAVTEAPPAPSIDLTVDKFAAFDSRTGYATLSGTATCTGDVEYAYLDAELSQNVGRFTVQGYGWADIACDGTAQRWTAQVRGSNGKFAGGKAASVTFAVACGGFECGLDYEEHVVQLRGKK